MVFFTCMPAHARTCWSLEKEWGRITQKYNKGNMMKKKSLESEWPFSAVPLYVKRNTIEFAKQKLFSEITDVLLNLGLVGTI